MRNLPAKRARPVNATHRRRWQAAQMKSYDVLVIGGGIAGVSIGYELADRPIGGLAGDGSDARLPHHRSFGRDVPGELRRPNHPAADDREPVVHGGSARRIRPAAVEAAAADLGRTARRRRRDAVRCTTPSSSSVPDMRVLTADEVVDVTKVIRPDWVAGGLLEPGASEIDVAALHGGYAGGLRARGGDIHTSAGVAQMRRVGDRWQVTDRAGNMYDAPVVVNAAGSWCDIVAGIAGAEPVGHPSAATNGVHDRSARRHRRSLDPARRRRQRHVLHQARRPADPVLPRRRGSVGAMRRAARGGRHRQGDRRHQRGHDTRHPPRSFVVGGAAQLRRRPLPRRRVRRSRSTASSGSSAKAGTASRSPPRSRRREHRWCGPATLPDELTARGLDAEALGRQRLAGLTSLEGH